MKKVMAEDLYRYKFVSKVQWNKKADKAVFTVHTTDEASNSYKADAWMYEDGKLTRLTDSGNVAGIQWLDEESLFFAGLRTEEDKAAAKKAPLSVFHKLSLKGGEAEELVRIPMKVLDLKPMGENKYALLAIYDRYPAEDRNPGWEVFDELPFWRNGEGYTSGTRKRLYIMDNGKLVPVTAENEGVTGWAVDNGRILYASQVYEDVVGMTAGITLYANGMKKELVKDGIYNVGGVFFKDGEPMALLNDRVGFGATKNPLFYELGSGKPVQVSTMDEHPAGTVVGDSAYGGGAQLAVDEGYIYYTTVDDTKSVLRRLKNGNLETVLTTYGSLDAITVKNGKILVSSVGQAKLPELYKVEDGQMIQISQFNEALYNERTIQMPHPVSAQSGTWQINGYVIYPADYEEGKTYPAILDIHGGPFGAYGAQFFHEMQVWSGAGYFVFYCNPRGGD
ncbi:MAG: S9 family peptidase, partial [Firmicutes bacterium]|nr:S9 family peptidase [Bacillota bacterium]